MEFFEKNLCLSSHFYTVKQESPPTLDLLPVTALLKSGHQPMFFGFTVSCQFCMHQRGCVCVCVHVPVCVWVLVCMFRISYWGLTLQTSVDEAKGKPVESMRSLTLMSDVTASGPIIDLGLKKKKRTDLSQK